MNIGELTFSSITGHSELLAESTRNYLLGSPGTSTTDVVVAEIDPAYAGGEELCAHYGIDPSMGGNCIIVEATRGDRKWYAACLVPTGSRMDLNGFVRKRLNARRVSLAPKDEVITMTGMEYGSITIVGLPDDWILLVDATLTKKTMVVMGSGLIKSKLALPGNMLEKLANVEVLDNLGISSKYPSPKVIFRD